MSQLVDSALAQIQTGVNISSNKPSATEDNTFKTLDCNAEISAAEKSLTDSFASSDNDYRLVKTESVSEEADIHDDDVDDTSKSELVESNSLFTEKETDVCLPSEIEVTSKEKRKLNQVRKHFQTAKGKSPKIQLKTNVIHFKRKKAGPNLKNKKDISNLKLVNKTVQVENEKPTNRLVKNSSEGNMKTEKPDEIDLENTVDLDLNSSPTLSQEIIENYVKEDKRNIDSAESTTERIYKCSYCDRLFIRIYHCNRHLASHAKKGVDKNKLKVIDTRVGRYSCKLCGEPFAMAYQLKAHVETGHPDYKPFNCEICGLSFKNREMLRKHQSTHTKPYCCEKCGQRFGQKVSLKTHMFKHTDSNLPCSYCEKIFKAPSTLKRHTQVSHLMKGLPVVKNHMCDLCGKSFKWRRLLLMHLQMHSGNKPCICEACGKSFARKDLLALHKKSHTDVKCYSCNVCNKSFTLRNYLTRHLQIHNTEKKLYKCEHCGRTFTRTDNLKTHLRLHSGDKPYKCETCGKSYTQAVSLAQHMNTHKHNFIDI